MFAGECDVKSCSRQCRQGMEPSLRCWLLRWSSPPKRIRRCALRPVYGVPLDSQERTRSGSSTGEQSEEIRLSYTQPTATSPSSHRNGSAVLVLHTWWGLNNTTRASRTTGRIRILTFAPDLYHGKVADTIAGAETLNSALDTKQAKADIAEATRSSTNVPVRPTMALRWSASHWAPLPIRSLGHRSRRHLIRRHLLGTRPGDYSSPQAA